MCVNDRGLGSGVLQLAELAAFRRESAVVTGALLQRMTQIVSENHRRFIPVIDLFAGPGGLGEGFAGRLLGAEGRELAGRAGFGIECGLDVHRGRVSAIGVGRRMIGDGCTGLCVRLE
ncbi:MAG: hypothetical protein DWQ34_18095 [Planctomycetota bacterium]|nr:MAG: hypothetical protein DWQ34_18095 [Planctomycetota bacterium]REJ91567.1 MAG: hypothetical protein DWQ29_05625 [Planctomycetota bacterium]REK21058.1 MAG: hypothetical protein DWQ41_22965 [Planctomycetota bacterium]REK38875.1 MAG: hypothetical protein DWQ45_03260 [Planctomycetota bacterium]